MKMTKESSGSSKASYPQVDISKHPESCRNFIGDAKIIKGQKKSQGTDDGFKDAVCSSSILKVAHQVVTGHKGKKFMAAHVEEAIVDPDDRCTELVSTSAIATNNKNVAFMGRRGSKSLPASPLGSPKTVRKNPFFTDHYTTITAGDTEKRGWLLSALIGLQREVVPSTSNFSIASQIDEEAEEIFESNNNVKFSHEEIPVSRTEKKAKPSELREMNFWSPTSM